MLKTISAILLYLCCLQGFAQTVFIKKIQLIGDKIVVHYDLEDGNPNNEYFIRLFCSKDNFTAPLQKVTGDIGIEVKPGPNKKIQWNIYEEYGGYSGKIALQVNGYVYIPFVKLQNFSNNRVLKRGKSHDLVWKVGGKHPVHIELFKGSQRVQGDLNHPNNGSFVLSIPSRVKPGKDFRVKFTDSKDGAEIIYSPYFRVKPKIPLVVKLIPLAAVGAAVLVLLGSKKPGGEIPSRDLPIPPVVPDN